MISGRIQTEDRVVLAKEINGWPEGSSLKARTVTRTQVEVSDWNASHQERLEGASVWLRRGTEVISCQEAGRRGIPPWDKTFPDGKVPSLPQGLSRFDKPVGIFISDSLLNMLLGKD